MLKRYLWLTLWLCITLRTHQVYGSDEREHVHIKVHMPDVVRKHKQPHKIFKHHHHKRPQALAHYAHQMRSNSRPPTPSSHTATDLGYYTKDSGFGSHVAPYFPTHLPTVLSETDSINNYGPVVFDNDIIPDKQPVAPAPPTFSKHLTAQMPISKHLFQQMLSPVTMTEIETAGGSNDFGGVNGAATELVGDNMNVLGEYFKTYATAMQQIHQPEVSSPSTLSKFHPHPMDRQRPFQPSQSKSKKNANIGIMEVDHFSGIDHARPFNQHHNHFVSKNQQWYNYDKNKNKYKNFNHMYESVEDDDEDFEDTSFESSAQYDRKTNLDEERGDSSHAANTYQSQMWNTLVPPPFSLLDTMNSETRKLRSSIDPSRTSKPLQRNHQKHVQVKFPNRSPMKRVHHTTSSRQLQSKPARQQHSQLEAQNYKKKKNHKKNIEHRIVDYF